MFFYVHLLQPVVVHQHVDYILKELRLFGAEKSTADLINYMPQLWDSIIVLLGIIPAQGNLDTIIGPRQSLVVHNLNERSVKNTQLQYIKYCVLQLVNFEWCSRQYVQSILCILCIIILRLLTHANSV